MKEQIKKFETTKWSCGCDDYVINRRVCSHMIYVRQNTYYQLSFFHQL